jgi:hypothetical protein
MWKRMSQVKEKRFCLTSPDKVNRFFGKHCSKLGIVGIGSYDLIPFNQWQRGRDRWQMDIA